MPLDGLDVVGRVGRQFGHGHFRRQLPHERPLGGIVVGKDQGVEPDIQAAGDFAEIGGLVVPVGHEAGDVVQAQDHFRMLFENFLGDVFAVLAAHGQQDAALLQGLGVVLEGEKGLALAVALAEADAAQAVVADHAAPEGVVEIEHEALLASSPFAPPAAMRR